ncbi:MAG: GH36 C-terminal domain-containing protein [Saccharofermentanales bacterium]
MLSWISDGDMEYTEDDNGQTLRLRYICSEPHLELISSWQTYPGTGPVVHQMTVRNLSPEEISIDYRDMVTSDIEVVSDEEVVLWNFTRSKLHPFSRWPGEPLANVGVLKHTFEYNSSFRHNICNDTHNGHTTNYPMLPFEIYDAGGKHGLYFCYEFAFGHFHDYSGEDIRRLHHRNYLWDAGVCTIAPGDLLKFPAGYIGAYSGDPDDAGNQVKRWFWNNRITRSMSENVDEPLVHCCVPAEEKSLQRFFDFFPVKEIGMEVCKIDIPWLDGTPMRASDWPQCDYDRLTCWLPHPVKWPHGMTAGKIIAEHGLRFSLWMSDTFEKVYIGSAEGREKEKKALLEKSLAYGFDTWRSDFELENRPFDYRTHEGFLEILDFMIENRPDFRYEHCSGAAALKDFSTLQRISVYTAEDSASALTQRKAFYTNSYMVNPVQIKMDIAFLCMDPDDDLKGTLRPFHDTEYAQYVIRSGFLGAYQSGVLDAMYDNLSEYELEHCDEIPAYQIITSHIRLYRERQRPILRGCNVYHVLPIPDNKNWDGIFFYNPDIGQGSLVVFKPSTEAVDGDAKTIRLRGLEPDAMYHCEFLQRTGLSRDCKGLDLMDNGIRISEMIGNHASEIVWLTKLCLDGGDYVQ